MWMVMRIMDRGGKMMNKEFRDWLEDKKRVSTHSYLNNGKLIIPNSDIEKELELIIKKYDKLHKQVVIPQYVADWITRYREKYDLYLALRLLENNTFVWGQIYEWYRMNTQKFVNAYLTGEYEVEEEPLYHALIKGHDVSNSDDIYWNYDKYDNDVFVSRLYPSHDNFLTEMSKSEWNGLGINDSNADFVRVKEME